MMALAQMVSLLLGAMTVPVQEKVAAPARTVAELPPVIEDDACVGGDVEAKNG
jgi:hypothetical protein